MNVPNRERIADVAADHCSDVLLKAERLLAEMKCVLCAEWYDSVRKCVVCSCIDMILCAEK